MIDTSDFDPMTLEELQDILGMTIKYDSINKQVTFLGLLSTYTVDNQLNISFRAPSSTGKSYIPLQIAQLFPREDVKIYAGASPTAFFHEIGEWDNERKVIIVNLEKKILIFLDQPHDQLLQKLRPLLSHDQKELIYKITDKKQKYGLKTKTVIIRGFSSVIFCTGSLKVDEQEATRLILLSPETSHEKVREALSLKSIQEGDPLHYKKWLEEDRRRQLLKARIEAIKNENIENIVVPNYDKVFERFVKEHQKLNPRHSRDIGKLFSLMKSLALLNVWHRERDLDENLVVNDEDIDNAFKLWNELSQTQELGLSPHVYRIFEEVIKPAYIGLNEVLNDEKSGLSRKQIIKKHYEIYGRPLQDWLLRQEILPALESAGLIFQQPNPNDRREILTCVVTL